MTHTPASGPFALVTTPPRSSLSIRIVVAPLCRALMAAGAKAIIATSPTPAIPTHHVLRFMFVSRVSPRTALRGQSVPKVDLSRNA